MKFVCDRCQTRYSISDEKVRGKVLKIRCKTCSNIIVVREPTTAVQTPAAAVSSAVAAGQGGAMRPPTPRTEVDLPRVDLAPKKGSADVEWWVAIKGQQHGPLKPADIERFFQEGRISAKSYCWNEGLAGWSRLRDLPDFAHLVSDPSTPAPRRPPPPPTDEALGAQVVDLQEARAQRQAQAQPPGPVTHDPFAAVAGPTPAADAAPRESTRVFIMQAGLANRGRKHKTYAIVAAVVFLSLVGLGTADWMGYIQIPGLHSALSYAAESAGVEEPKRRKFLASFDEAESDPAMRCQLMGDCPEPKRGNGKRSSKGGVTSDLDLDSAFGQAGSGGSGIGRAGAGGGIADIGDPLGSDADRAKEIANIFGKDKKRLLKPTAKIEAPSVSSGSGLDGEQIFKVVKDNQEAIKSCVESGVKNGSTVEGKQYLVLTIVPKGVVSSARFKNAVTTASPVGECITRRARKWKFPAFAGEAFDVEIPLILSTSL